MLSVDNLATILFDLDGTLLHSLPSGGEVFTDYAIRLGIPISDEDRRRAAIWEHYYFAMSPEIRQDRVLFNGDGDEAFWNNFSQRRLIALGCPRDLVPKVGRKISAYMRDSYDPRSWIPEDVHSILPILRDAGYVLGVVSNRDKPFVETLEELNLSKYFEFSLAAGEVDSWKPDSKIFMHALRLAKSDPSNTLYIGDNYFADVVGARKAGLQPVLFDRKGLFQGPNCEVISSFNDLIQILPRK